jgi:hypothetical protein
MGKSPEGRIRNLEEKKKKFTIIIITVTPSFLVYLPYLHPSFYLTFSSFLMSETFPSFVLSLRFLRLLHFLKHFFIPLLSNLYLLDPVPTSFLPIPYCTYSEFLFLILAQNHRKQQQRIGQPSCGLSSIMLTLAIIDWLEVKRCWQRLAADGGVNKVQI